LHIYARLFAKLAVERHPTMLDPVIARSVAALISAAQKKGHARGITRFGSVRVSYSPKTE
jgi:hypothetical protein